MRLLRQTVPPLTLAILGIESVLFAKILRVKQLAPFSGKLSEWYPAAYHYEGVVEIFLLLATAVCLGAFFSRAVLGSTKWRTATHWDAASYAIFFLRLSSVPAIFIVALWLLVKAAMAVFYWRALSKPARISQWNKVKPALIAFVLILTLQIALNDMISPVGWSNPIPRLDKGEGKYLPVSSLLYRTSYVGAKHLDFSGFDNGYWGAISHYVTGFTSPVVSLLAIALDLPAMDVESFHRTVMAVAFLCCVLGSIGFYLFCQVGLGLTPAVSTLGGLLFLFANPSLAILVTRHYPAFAGPFLILPYSLWAAHRAARNRSLLAAFSSGALLALPFYLLAPHPETVIHALLFQSLYSFYLFFRPSGLRLGESLRLLFATFLGFGFAGAYSLCPILEEIFRQEASFFGHHEALFKHSLRIGLSGGLLPLLATQCVFFFLMARHLKATLKITRESAFFLFFALVGLLFLIPGKSGPLASWLTQVGFPLSFLNPFRVLPYVTLATLAVGLSTLDAVLIKGRLSLRFGILAGIVAPITLVMFRLWFRSQRPTFFETWEILPWKLFLQFVIPTATVFLGLAYLFHRQITRPATSRGGVFCLLFGAALGAVVTAVTGYQAAERPNQLVSCRPYRSVQAMVSDYKGLGQGDSASLAFLKEKLVLIEKTFSKQPTNLSGFADPKAIVSTAEKCAPLFDSWAVDQGACLHPTSQQIKHFQFPDPVAYNNSALLGPLAPFQRTMNLTGDYSGVGIGGNEFLLNSTLTMDPRFQVGYGPLEALYLMPGEYFQQTGRYELPVPWLMDSDKLKDPNTRALWNLAGVSAYLLPEGKVAPGLTEAAPFSTRLPEPIRPPYRLFLNPEARPIAYLAESIAEVPDQSGFWKTLKPPFREGNSRGASYRSLVDALTLKLTQLSLPRAVLVEKTSEVSSKTLAPSTPRANQLHTRMIRGNRAAFEIECRSEPCLLVYNSAALSGWRAFAENTPLKTVRVNFAFLGIEVPKGTHLVWLEYRRFGASLGLILTLVTFLALLVIPLSRATARLPVTFELSSQA